MKGKAVRLLGLATIILCVYQLWGKPEALQIHAKTTDSEDEAVLTLSSEPSDTVHTSSSEQLSEFSASSENWESSEPSFEESSLCSSESLEFSESIEVKTDYSETQPSKEIEKSTEIPPKTKEGETKEKSADLPKELPVTPLPEVIEENYQFSVIKNQSTSEFIEAVSVDAQQVAWDNDLYASVMIAQAILETGSGNSQLSRPPYYNLFGIKGEYQKQSVNFETKEDNGKGQLYSIHASFRKYPGYKESLEDYAQLLKNGISGNSIFYQMTWKSYAATYKDATKALTGRYATDTYYDKKLNTLIETYQLTRFDQAYEKTSNIEKEDVIRQTESQNASSESEIQHFEPVEKDRDDFGKVLPEQAIRPLNEKKTKKIIETPINRIKGTDLVN